MHVVAEKANGATVEREVPTGFDQAPFVMLNLHVPDFTTSARLVEGINKLLGDATAQAVDGVSVKVAAPSDPNQRIAYLSTLEQIEIEPGDAPARVIVNSRTGTVVIGSRVRVMPAAVAHGSLTVEIRTDVLVSQPEPLAEKGRTVVVPQTGVAAGENRAAVMEFSGGATMAELVRALNALRVTPRDIVAIIQAIKSAGALFADLELQ